MTKSTGRSSKKRITLHEGKSATEIVFHLSLDELTLLHLTLKHFNRYERPKDEELGLSLALRLHSFLASERTRRVEEIR